jgi:hypothetical protein
MTSDQNNLLARDRLRRGIVLRVHEDECEIAIDGRRRWVGYASQFPSPRKERVSPGHLVAVVRRTRGRELIVWRWYDAVVIEELADLVTLWEPAHGVVSALRRTSYASTLPGARAYLSAGLPGAEWWVAGPVVADPQNAHVELDEVERFYNEHGLWDDLTSG